VKERFRRFVVVLGVAIAAGFPVGIPAAESTTGAIVGTVSGERAMALPNAELIVRSAAGRSVAHSDARGRFTLLGLVADVYLVTVSAPGYATETDPGIRVIAGTVTRASFVLHALTQTIGTVRARSAPFVAGAPADTFSVNGADAQARAPVASSSGLATYLQGTVQGAIAGVPGVDLDAFGNAILRAGRVGDAVYEYDSVPIPQGLIAEPGGNVAGAQLPATGVASTHVTLAGYANESDNALGGVVDQIAATGTYPSRTTIELGDGVGSALHDASAELLAATPDLKWRYALATSVSSDYFPYGDGHTFYPAEAGTYGLALQSRSAFSIEGNVHDQVTPADDVSLLVLAGQAAYDQYDSPFAGETLGAFDGATTTYPGETNPNAPVTYASGVRGSLDVISAVWQHVAGDLVSRLQVDESRYGSSAGGPFWDENGFPDGTISLAETSAQHEYGVSLDNEAIAGRHDLRAGIEFRTTTSYLDQVVPTADEFISSNPTVHSGLAYASDTWSLTDRVQLTGSARATLTHIAPSDGPAYDANAIDPHAGIGYRFGSDLAVRANYDRITVAPAPLEADRTDTADEVNGVPAPFVELGPETANDYTYSFEGGGRTAFRLTYYQKFESDLIDVLPYDFRSAVAAGSDPTDVGVPTNVGSLRASGLEFYLQRGRVHFTSNLAHAASSSASQFAYNDLNAPAIAAGHLFPVSYQPDFTAQLSYAFALARGHVRITPALSYESGYPYGNGTMVYIFDPVTGKPIEVPNDNAVNPGANYYFLKDPALPYNTVTNPYIGTLGTNEGTNPDTLRTMPQTLVNLHVEADLTKRVTLVVDVANLLGTSSPTAYQNNPYLIGPPGYTGGNAAYAACYGKILAGGSCAAPGPAAVPYALGNGVPTNDGVTQSVPWSYGTGGYVPQSYPLARTIELRLRYRL